MKHKTLITLSWVGLIGAVVFLAIRSPIFDNRGVSIGYELISLAAGIALILVAFVAVFLLTRRLAPGAPYYVAWLLLLLALGAVASGKIVLDDWLRRDRAGDASIARPVSPGDNSLSKTSIQLFAMSMPVWFSVIASKPVLVLRDGARIGPRHSTVQANG